MAHSWKDNLLLKVVNLIAYFFFLGSNLYGFLGAKGAGKETYFTPAQWVLIVWPIIHLLLLGFVIYQFFEPAHSTVVEGVSWRFPLLCVLNAIYANLFVHGHYIVAFVFMLLVSLTVSHIYRSLAVHHPVQTLSDAIFVHLPFSLWHGFSVVLVIATAFAAFGVDKHTENAGIATKILVFVALFFLESTSAAYVYYGEGDVAGAAVICFAIFGIFMEQTEDRFIHWSALVFFIISLLAVVQAVIRAFRARRDSAVVEADPERAPLVA